jgi:hypothetical protein
MLQRRHPSRTVANDEPDRLRRGVALSLVVGAFATAFSGRLLAAPAGKPASNTPIEVWTGPSCGCCKEWVRHLQENGFDVVSHEGGNSEARKRLGMPAKFGSCHSAEIRGYAIEGHVPAREIRRLVEEEPDAIGISVPAMPRGSPGMDGPAYNNVKDPYDVLLVAGDGSASVFQSYR